MSDTPTLLGSCFCGKLRYTLNPSGPPCKYTVYLTFIALAPIITKHSTRRILPLHAMSEAYGLPIYRYGTYRAACFLLGHITDGRDRG
jgi:hypothetical protein